MKVSTELVDIKYYAIDVLAKFNNIEIADLNFKHAKGIFNAYRNSAVIDGIGIIWVSTEKLHTILRTNKAKARKIVSLIDIRQTRTIKGKKYIRGDAIIQKLSESIFHSGDYRREEYLKFSELIFRFVRDSKEAQLLRRKYDQFLKRERSKLKYKRYRNHRVKKDELTNDELLYKTSHFSHIRSVAVYPELALEVWNGLLVNVETHKKLTAAGVQDEEELRELCRKENWTLEWHRRYLNCLRSLGYGVGN